jgi:hypothetical protein
MKYRHICLVALLGALCVSIAGPAEAFLPGMPSFSQWCCAPSQKPDCSVAGKLGYLGYNRPLIFEIGAVGTPLQAGGVDLLGLRTEIPVEGLWLGASVTGAGSRRGVSSCDPGDPLCLSVGATWLDPNNKEGSGLHFIGSQLPDDDRTWRPSIQWYTLEASASRCLGNFSLIGGFRFDSFMTSLANTAGPGAFFGLASDEAEFKLSSYIPYVGAVTRWGAVELGFIGFPWVPGTVLYKETFGLTGQRLEASGTYRNAYFFEAFADVGGRLGVVHLSAFALYTMLHATGELNVTVTGNPSSQPYTFGIDRQNWIVGGKAVVGFISPI